MYVVHGAPKSRVLRVLWLLEELGQPYELQPNAPHSAEQRAVNPSGKIPALTCPEGTLTDSVAILSYLADRHGAFTAAPGSFARARQDALVLQILDEIEAPLWTAARHSFVLPPEQRVPAVKDSLKWEFARNLQGLVARLRDQPFLMGDRPSVADILLAHCLSWAAQARFPEPPAELAAYLARMTARPAFARALAAA